MFDVYPHPPPPSGISVLLFDSPLLSSILFLLSSPLAHYDLSILLTLFPENAPPFFIKSWAFLLICMAFAEQLGVVGGMCTLLPDDLYAFI